jgi:hypothetical protein
MSKGKYNLDGIIVSQNKDKPPIGWIIFGVFMMLALLGQCTG